VHVLNGERYKELCPENQLLSHVQLKTCIVSHHQKALLKRDGGADDQLRCFLQLEVRGGAKRGWRRGDEGGKEVRGEWKGAGEPKEV
jgi:hypothetical protein